MGLALFCKILAPVRGDGLGGCVLAYATTLAFQHNAFVEVVHCRPTPQNSLPKGGPIPGFIRQNLYAQVAERFDAEEEAMREQFEHFARVLNFAVATEPTTSSPSAVWHEEQGDMPDVIKRRGLLSDIIVVTKPDRDRNVGVNTLQAALFNTGRPVLMCPRISKRPDTFGSHVAVAWNGSLESARAVGLAMPILERADTVTVLTAGREAPSGARAEELQEYLAIRGVKSSLDRFDVVGKAGKALLRRCDEIGSDLMVMGAYGESHEKEAIFGGNSQTIVDEAEIPVVMVH